MGAKHSLMATETTPACRDDCPEPARPHVTDPKKMVHLTFTAHLHGPTDLCPSFSFYKPGKIFGTLETIFEILAHCLLGIGLTEINSFLVSQPLMSLPLDFASGQWSNVVCLEPQPDNVL